jgi:hypothetical protein
MGIAPYSWSNTQQAPLGFVHTVPASAHPTQGEVEMVYIQFTVPDETVGTNPASTEGALVKHAINGQFALCTYGEPGDYSGRMIGFIQTDLYTAVLTDGIRETKHPAYVAGDIVYGFVVRRGVCKVLADVAPGVVTDSGFVVGTTNSGSVVTDPGESGVATTIYASPLGWPFADAIEATANSYVNVES